MNLWAYISNAGGAFVAEKHLMMQFLLLGPRNGMIRKVLLLLTLPLWLLLMKTYQAQVMLLLTCSPMLLS